MAVIVAVNIIAECYHSAETRDSSGVLTFPYIFDKEIETQRNDRTHPTHTEPKCRTTGDSTSRVSTT